MEAEMSSSVDVLPTGVVTYPRDALLTIDEVATALRVSVRTVERMDLPTVYCGPKNRRYLWGQILDVLAERAA